jgi:hypothetical protein
VKSFRMLRRISFIAVALIAVVIGVHSIDLRALYAEMYPAEPVKRDAFHICDETDPTFLRAVGSDREACYGSMPHIMAVAMGRIRPGGALSMQALTDPSREAELLMLIAAMPPRQPITRPRSFSNTKLSAPCDDKPLAAVSYAAPNGLSGGMPAGMPPSGTRAAALDSTIRNNLPPPLPGTTQQAKAPVIKLGPVAPLISSPDDPNPKPAAINPAPVSAPDVGDDGPPAIVPLAPTLNCDGT